MRTRLDRNIIIAIISALAVVLAAIISIIPFVISAIQQNPRNQSFPYTVRVQDKGTSIGILNAKVTIDVPGSAPIDDFTDSNGFARIFVESNYVGLPGILLVEAPDYKTYRQNINIRVGILPDIIFLERGVQSNLPATVTSPPIIEPSVSIPPTSAQITATPSTPIPANTFSTTEVQDTAIPLTSAPPTRLPVAAAIPTTVPATSAPPTPVPPTPIPPTPVPPTPIPPTSEPTPWGAALSGNWFGVNSDGTQISLTIQDRQVYNLVISIPANSTCSALTLNNSGPLGISRNRYSDDPRPYHFSWQEIIQVTPGTSAYLQVLAFIEDETAFPITIHARDSSDPLVNCHNLADRISIVMRKS